VPRAAATRVTPGGLPTGLDTAHLVRFTDGGVSVGCGRGWPLGWDRSDVTAEAKPPAKRAAATKAAPKKSVPAQPTTPSAEVTLDAPVRARKYGWGPLVVISLVVATAPAEAGSISVGLDDLKHHFHVSDFWLGALPFFMSFVGIFWRFLVGWFTDRMSRVTLLSALIAIYALLMGLQALAIAFWMIVAFRVLLSFTESTEPPTQSLFGDYFPVEERGRRLAVYNTLTGIIGGLLPLALTGVLVDQFGWRAIFLMWAPFGVLCAVLMRRLPEPERGNQDAEFERELAEITARLATADESAEEVVNPHALVREMAQDEVAHIHHPVDYDYTTAPWREVYGVIWRVRSWSHIVIAWALAQVFLNGMMWFGVTYFKRSFGLSDTKAGGYAAMIGLGALPGVLVGGYLADRMLRRGMVNARVWVLAVSLLIGPVTFIPALLIHSLWMALPFFVLTGFFLSLPTACNDAIMTDVIIPELRGRSAAAKGAVQAWANAGPALVGGISALLTHAFGLGSTVSLRVGLLSMIPLYVLGAIIAFRAIRFYPADLAYVVAHARERYAATQAQPE
jgi:MFS family permease